MEQTGENVFAQLKQKSLPRNRRGLFCFMEGVFLKLSLSKSVLVLLGLLLLIPSGGRCETAVRDEFGGMLGVSLTVGTVCQRLGVIARGYYAGSDFQGNLEMGAYYNFASFGPPISGPEIRTSLGGVFTWGERDEADNVFLTSISNQTGHKYSLAYAYTYYWDRIQTSQPTGTIALQADAFHLISENDFFAGRGGDKFRTGAISAAYRNGKTMAAIKTVLWTGDTGKNTRKVQDPEYPGRFGYKDMRQAPHGAFSHGILSAQVQYAWCGFQTLGAEVGVDSEKVRHAVQNRFIHDMGFLPDKWVPHENPHVPMRAAQGGPFLFKEGQTIKPAEPFMAFSMNPSLFY
jgi:hypothetical protein